VLLASALLFASRRLSGALEVPLPTTTLLIAAIVASLAALTTVRAADVTQVAGWCIASAAAASVVLLGAALSVPGTSTMALSILWLLTLSIVGLIAKDILVRGRGNQMRSAIRIDRRVNETSIEGTSAPGTHVEPPDNRDVWQWLSRIRTKDGEDRLEGWVRVECPAGQRGEVVHLAFCPPFQRIPKFEAHCQSGPTARIKVSQLMPHAARVELKLDTTPREQTNLVIGLSAVCPAENIARDTA